MKSFDKERATKQKLWEIDRNMMFRNWNLFINGRGAAHRQSIWSKCDDETQIDSVIHAMLVRDCQEQNIISTHVNKFLNKKFSGLVCVFQSLKTSEAVLENWQRLLSDVIIPGGYWVAITHNILTIKDKTRIFSDVHMLSHLVGSSNQSHKKVG